MYNIKMAKKLIVGLNRGVYVKKLVSTILYFL